VNLTAVLLTGLFAGGISCAAVQGGLLAGLITRQRAASAPLAVVGAAHDSGRHRADGHRSETHRSEPHRSEPHRGQPARALPPQPRLGDDLAPVGGFLTGKLLSHTVLGALLGALGSVVQLSVGTRTIVQILAGLLIISFGLAQLGAPGFRRIVIEPPASWMRLVGKSARSQSALAPTLLGMATLLIPCGITLSMESIALAAGSPVTGAATMAVFVIGTGPLFAVLGYAARKAATVWRGRLAAATGVVVIVTGLLTLNGGLELAGSPLAASHLAADLATTSDSSHTATAASTITDGHQTVTITAASDGYNPSTTRARAGIPTTLLIHSAGAEGCIRAFTIPELNVQHILPATGDTRIDIGPLHPGTLGYVCGMGMYTGTITTN
jgi:sulfite exporter TauE/SafE